MVKDQLWRLGDQYAGAPIDPAGCDPDPITQFRAWFAVAVGAGIPSVNAMTLATVDEHGRPDARIVLLKEVDDKGFVFFTNYTSRKGRELAGSPYAALVLFWESLHRQVRVQGSVERITAEESDAYFASRPRGSQLGAIVSPQSQPIASRVVIEDGLAKLTQDLGDREPPRPASWGGYRVVPDQIELWQGQASRLHDRVRYRLTADGWIRDRLAP